MSTISLVRLIKMSRLMVFCVLSLAIKKFWMELSLIFFILLESMMMFWHWREARFRFFSSVDVLLLLGDFISYDIPFTLMSAVLREDSGINSTI